MSELHVKAITVSDPDHIGLELNTLRDLHAPCSVVSVSHAVQQRDGGEQWSVLIVLEISDGEAMDRAEAAVEARE